MSGRGLFRKVRNLNNSQCEEIWRRLPRESRNMWNNEARCSERQEKESQPESKEYTLSWKDSRPQPSRANLFGFMHKSM